MQTIPVSTAVECTELLGECTEMGDDPRAWQDHLVDRAQRLIGGFATAFKILRVQAGEPVFDEAIMSHSSDAAMRLQFERCLRDGAHKDMPALARLMPHVFSTGELAFRYSDLSGGLRSFHDSPFYDRYLRSVSVGDALAVNNAQTSGHVVSLWVMRHRSERSFSAHEQGTLAFINALLSRMVGSRLATRSQLGRPTLPPRARQTLEALLEGDSEKQIAARFGLQRTTVHGYVRQLYRHFGVRRRGELMARFVKRVPGRS